MNDDTTTEDIPQPYDLPYMAWTLLANVSEGDWTKQTPEWQGAVVRWRDEFHAWLADGTAPTEPAPTGLEPGEIVAPRFYAVREQAAGEVLPMFYVVDSAGMGRIFLGRGVTAEALARQIGLRPIQNGDPR